MILASAFIYSNDQKKFQFEIKIFSEPSHYNEEKKLTEKIQQILEKIGLSKEKLLSFKFYPFHDPYINLGSITYSDARTATMSADGVYWNRLQGIFYINSTISSEALPELHKKFEEKQQLDLEKFLLNNNTLYCIKVINGMDRLKQYYKKSTHPNPQRGHFFIDFETYSIFNGVSVKIDVPNYEVRDFQNKINIEKIYPLGTNLQSQEQATEAIKLIKMAYREKPIISASKNCNAFFHFKKSGSFNEKNLGQNIQKNLNVTQAIAAISLLLVSPSLINLNNQQEQQNSADIELTKEGMKIKFICLNHDIGTVKEYGENFCEALEKAGYGKYKPEESYEEIENRGIYCVNIVIPDLYVKSFLTEVCRLNTKQIEEYEALHTQSQSLQQSPSNKRSCILS